MLKPNFQLTKKIPLEIVRSTQGQFVKGRWESGTPEIVVIQANIQPYTMSKLMQLPEVDRTKDWYSVFSADMIRDKREGEDGWDADKFEWDGNTYIVNRVRSFSMGILNHYEAQAVRVERT